eukprot:Trichotokara_eunicae@DN5430_c0_g1_i1.p1
MKQRQKKKKMAKAATRKVGRPKKENISPIKEEKKSKKSAQKKEKKTFLRLVKSFFTGVYEGIVDSLKRTDEYLTVLFNENGVPPSNFIGDAPRQGRLPYRSSRRVGDVIATEAMEKENERELRRERQLKKEQKKRKKDHILNENKNDTKIEDTEIEDTDTHSTTFYKGQYQ